MLTKQVSYADVDMPYKPFFKNFNINWVANSQMLLLFQDLARFPS